jgi:hypothetical protein
MMDGGHKLERPRVILKAPKDTVRSSATLGRLTASKETWVFLTFLVDVVS